MRSVMKATGRGLTHFFGARDSLDDYKAMGRQFTQSNKVRKAEILAIMGMYTAYKGSPIRLARNIRDSIEVGTWKHGDMKRHQGKVDDMLATTRMSDEGKRTAANLVNRGGSADAIASLSAHDAAKFKQLETALHIAAGSCINF